MNLHLINGIEIVDAHLWLYRFMEAKYELYDGISTPHDSTLSLYDILLSIMINFHVGKDTADKAQSIWDKRAPVEMALSGIPADIALEDENIPWDELEVLFDAFHDIPCADAKVATKMLHRKRPKLIPIFDYVMITCLNGVNDDPSTRGKPLGERMVRDMKRFRRLLLGSLDEINTIRGLPVLQRFPVSAVRVLELLIWIDNGYSGDYISCPQCCAAKVISIYYGEKPLDWIISRAKKGEVLLVNNRPQHDSPRWHCTECAAEFGRVRFPR